MFIKFLPKQLAQLAVSRTHKNSCTTAQDNETMKNFGYQYTGCSLFSVFSLDFLAHDKKLYLTFLFLY